MISINMVAVVTVLITFQNNLHSVSARVFKNILSSNLHCIPVNLILKHREDKVLAPDRSVLSLESILWATAP